MERTVNVTFVSSCSTGHPSACLVSYAFLLLSFLLFGLVVLASVITSIYMHGQSRQ